MAYKYNLPNFTGGIDETLIEVSTELPVFPIMFLVFVWVFIFIGGTSQQSKRFGYADYPFWAVIASLNIFLISLIMTLTAGIIKLEVLGIVLAITVITGVWFFLTKGRTEI